MPGRSFRRYWSIFRAILPNWGLRLHRAADTRAHGAAELTTWYYGSAALEPLAPDQASSQRVGLFQPRAFLVPSLERGAARVDIVAVGLSVRVGRGEPGNRPSIWSLPRQHACYASICSDRASASSTSTPRHLIVRPILNGLALQRTLIAEDELVWIDA